jgi:hypothetical protein
MSFSRIIRATGHLAAAILASAAYVKRADSEFSNRDTAAAYCCGWGFVGAGKIAVLKKFEPAPGSGVVTPFAEEPVQ